MSLSSQNLDAFYACSQAGHFTRAAEALHITQSALSQRISKLEDELQTALFIRDRSGIRLTAAGEELLRYCSAKEALENESLERIVRKQKDKQAYGTIRIGGFSSVMRSAVLPSLSPILKTNSNLNFNFLTKEINELPELFRRGEIDYMVLFHEFVHDQVETIFLGNEENVLVEKKGYKGPEVYLDHDDKDQTTTKYFRLRGWKRKIRRRYMDDVYGLIDGIKNGLGRAVMPIHMIEKEKGLNILQQDLSLKFPVYLHFYRQPYYSQLHNLIIKQLTENVPGLLQNSHS